MFRGVAERPVWTVAKNIGSTTIPAMCVVELETAGGIEAFGPSIKAGDFITVRARRPTAANLTNIGVNSDTPILANGYGLVAVTGPVFVDAKAALTTGGLYGTKVDSFVLETGTGLVAIASCGLTNVFLMDFVRSAGLKQMCRFTLDEAMTTSDEHKEATITAQYGQGASHASNDITVYNLLASDSSYVFEGVEDAAGLAYWDSGTNWYIVQMECP